MKYIKTYEGLVEDFRELTNKKDEDYSTLIIKFDNDTEKLASKYINDLKENVIVPLTDNYRCVVKHRLREMNPNRDGQLWAYIRVFMDNNDKDFDFLEKNLKEFQLNLKASTLNDMMPFYTMNDNKFLSFNQLIEYIKERTMSREYYFDIHLKK